VPAASSISVSGPILSYWRLMMFRKLGRWRAVTSKEGEISNLLLEFQVCLPPRRCSGTPATLSRNEEPQSLRVETAKAANVGSPSPAPGRGGPKSNGVVDRKRSSICASPGNHATRQAKRNCSASAKPRGSIASAQRPDKRGREYKISGNADPESGDSPDRTPDPE